MIKKRKTYCQKVIFFIKKHENSKLIWKNMPVKIWLQW